MADTLKYVPKERNKVWFLRWNKETIEDDIESREEAERLQKEYQMAFGNAHSVVIRSRKEEV